MKLPLLLASLLAASVAYGETFYTQETPGEQIAAYGDFGITFKLNSDISVTELSFFAQSLGGGDTPYVQLWDDDKDVLIASVEWAAGETEAGWNSKALKKPVTLQRGITYQIQSSAYWAPTHTKRDFTFHEVVESTKFHQNDGWSDWSAPEAPSKGSPSKAPAAMANFNFDPEK